MFSHFHEEEKENDKQALTIKEEEVLLEKQDFPEHWTVPSVRHLQVLQLSPLSNTSPLI